MENNENYLDYSGLTLYDQLIKGHIDSGMTAFEEHVEEELEILDDVAYLGPQDVSAVTADFDPEADTLWKKAQVLTSAEKTQVKENLGLDEDLTSLANSVNDEAVRATRAEGALDEAKADKATTIAGYGITDAYTKTEVDTKDATKADKATTLAGYGITNAYTKAEVDAKDATKADKATTLAGYGITDAYTKAEVDAGLDECAHIGDYDGSAVTASFDPMTDTVWNKEQILSNGQKAQARQNINVYSKEEVNSLAATPHQNYVTVATYSELLQQSGSTDTIYRVSNYDGSTSTSGTTVYSEYAWNGSNFVFLAVKSEVGEVYDISYNHAGATYLDLSAALGTNGANVPEGLRKGGMSVKFVQSSDNKYVQFRCMSNAFTTDITQWAVCDDSIYIENPEFITVLVDKEDNIVIAIRKNGDVLFGAGVPKQIRDYVSEKISELSLDEYSDIVNFLGNLIEGSDTLQNLLNKKVDKVEGKELSSNDYTDTDKEIVGMVKLIECPKYIAVITDKDDSIIVAIKKNGDVLFGFGVPSQIQEEIARIEALINNIGNSKVSREFNEDLKNKDVLISSHKGIIEIEDGGLDFEFNYKSAKKQSGIELGATNTFIDQRMIWVYMKQQTPISGEIRDHTWGMACDVSKDGIHFANIEQNDGCVFDMRTSNYGGWLRDPSLIKKGTTYYTAFTYKGGNEQVYGIARSTNLTDWTICGMVTSTYNNEVLYAAAPEILYIDDKVYVIFQAGKYDNAVRARCFIQEIPDSVLNATETDVTISASFIDLGKSTIDHYVVKHNGEYYLFCDSSWCMFLYKAFSIYGPYKFVKQVYDVEADGNLGSGEGYCIVQFHNVFYLYTSDSDRGVEMYKSADLINWEFVGKASDSYRHGSMAVVNAKVNTQEILNDIL